MSKKVEKKPPKVGVLYFASLAKGAALGVLIFSLLINMLMLTGPIFMLQVYDRVLSSASVPTLIGLSALVVFLYLFFGFLDYIRSRIMLQVANKTDALLHDKAFKAVGHDAVKGNGETQTLPLIDLSTIRQFLSGQAPFAFLDVPWTPVYLAAIYFLHPVLGVAAALAALVLIIIAITNNFFTRKAMQTAGGLSARANASGEEYRRNAEVASALGMQPSILHRWTQIHSEAMEEYARASNKSGLFGSMSKALRMIFQSGMLGLGAYLAILQEITPGAMIAGSIIMARALAPVDQLIANWQGYLSFRQARTRLNDALAETPFDENEFPLPRPKGRLQVKGLTMNAPGRIEPILSNLTFEIEAGDGLCIIGPTGSGKTTLARIIVGVKDRYFGSVEVDGSEVKNYPAEDYGRAIGYMPQEVHLFEGTIAENIARMDENPDPDAVIAAAMKANAHELIKSLPEGYNTLLREGGANLSSGQRQRIGLARAFFGDPVILVLDEPNANLDHDGEMAIVASLAAARKDGTTVIVIAHRPSAIKALNKVLYLKNGRQLAFGPRDEVLERILQKPDGDTPGAPSPAGPSRPPSSPSPIAAMARPAAQPRGGDDLTAQKSDGEKRGSSAPSAITPAQAWAKSQFGSQPKPERESRRKRKKEES